MSYAETMMMAGLWVLLLAGVTGVILGFANTATEAEFKSHGKSYMVIWSLALVVGVLVAIFAGTTLGYLSSK